MNADTPADFAAARDQAQPIAQHAASHNTFRYLGLGVIGAAAWWLIYRRLAPLSVWLTYRVLSFQPNTHLGSAVEFFLFEVPNLNHLGQFILAEAMPALSLLNLLYFSILNLQRFSMKLEETSNSVDRCASTIVS